MKFFSSSWWKPDTLEVDCPSFSRVLKWHLRVEEFAPQPDDPLKHGPGPIPEVLAADLPQRKALGKNLGLHMSSSWEKPLSAPATQCVRVTAVQVH